MRNAARPDPRELRWLVLRAQAGDRAALERLLRTTEATLRPYFDAMIADADTREDALQETLVLLYRKIGSLREPRAFGAWARRIASREAFRALRRSRREELLHEDVQPESVAEDERPETLPQDIRPLLGQISARSREVLVLHYLEA